MRPSTSGTNEVDNRLGERPLDLTFDAKRLEGKTVGIEPHDDAGDKMAYNMMQYDAFLDPEDTKMMVDVSEGTSHSSCAENNSNSNGKTLAIGLLDNVNDNRQYMPDGPVLKKVKQISMEEIPLHLTGLGLSGSGMQLFVKMDRTMEQRSIVSSHLQTLQQVHNASKCVPPPQPRTKKKARNRSVATRRKRNSLIETHGCKDTEMNDRPNGLLNTGHPNEEMGKQNQGKKEQIQMIAEPINLSATEVKRPDIANPKTRKRNADRAKHGDQVPQRPMSCNIYGCNQNFQPTSSLAQTQNIISGPTWNVENGQIDIIKSQAMLRSPADLQTTSNGYSVPLDHGMSHFPRGFESRDLPLKRRYNSPIRERSRSTSPFLPKQCPKLQRRGRNSHRYYNASSDIDDDEEDDDDENNGNFCPDNDEMRKVGRGKKMEREKKNMAQTKPNTSRERRMSVHDEEAVSDLFHKNPRPNVSEVSHGEQSSIGPQFETKLLHQGTMETETMIKFTEYTQELRKDLKQKYKDMSKLLKAFEDTVQQHNNNQTEEGTEETVSKEGRCTLM